MKMTIKSVLAILPFSVLAACGAVKQASPVLTGDESALMGAADANDEADELVADHVEEVSSLLDLEDDSAGVSALGLAANKQKSLEKNCVVEAGKLTLSKQKTVSLSSMSTVNNVKYGASAEQKNSRKKNRRGTAQS